MGRDGEQLGVVVGLLGGVRVAGGLRGGVIEWFVFLLSFFPSQLLADTKKNRWSTTSQLH